MARENDEEEVVEDAVAEELENKGCGIGRVLFRSIEYCGPVSPSSSSIRSPLPFCPQHKLIFDNYTLVELVVGY